MLEVADTMNCPLERLREAQDQQGFVSDLGSRLVVSLVEASSRQLGKPLTLYSWTAEMDECLLQGWRVYQWGDQTVAIAYQLALPVTRKTTEQIV